MTQTISSVLSDAFNRRDSLSRRAQSLRTEAATTGLSVLALFDFYQLIQRTFEAINPLIARDVSLGGDLDLNALAQSSLIDPPADVMAVFASMQSACNAYQTYLDDPAGLIPTDDGTDAGYRAAVKLLPTGGAIEYRHYAPSELSQVRTLLQGVIDAAA